MAEDFASALFTSLPAIVSLIPAAPEQVLATRAKFDVQTRSISLGQYTILASLASHATLSEAAERGFATDPEFDLAEGIRLMLEAGAMQHHLS